MKSTIVLFITLVLSCGINVAKGQNSKKDNILFIMVDDLGIEGFSSYGSKISTPNIDKLADGGILFNHCYANPNCTPTRTKLMTGMRNYKSYENFGYLNPKHKTIGNLMKQVGYATCIAGKWQLNGSQDMGNYPPSYDNINRAYDAGFDTYQLWSYVESTRFPRYRDAKFYENGKVETAKYGPDAHYNFIADFIKENKDKPFFVYYPMVLVHAPREITPDSKYWNMPEDKRPKSEGIESQIKYVDKIVGQLVQTLKEEGVYDNTIIFFTCDNGTGRGTTIETKYGHVRGGKGTLTDAGTHVPLIIHSSKIKKSSVRDDLIDFSDFYPTFADIGGVNVSKEKNLDGISLLPLISGNDKKYKTRKFLFMQFDSRRTNRIEWDSEHRNRFARTAEYKLYHTGEFYCVKKDVLEQNLINLEKLTKHEKKIHQQLQIFLDDINKEYLWEDEWIPEKTY